MTEEETKSVGPSSPRSPQLNVETERAKVHSPRQQKRIKMTQQQLEAMTKEELIAKWNEQDLYVESLEALNASQEGELASLRESEEKYRQQHAEASHREKILVRRLASKEQELQEYINQIAEMKAAHAPSAAALRSALLDPAVNILIQKLRQELVTTKAKLEDTQNELSAWKFTPDSNTGKRLMAKCRLLYQENEELGRMIASGRIAKLEGELALQKSFSEEVKKSQSELDEFLQDLDEDVEGMQSTIYFLQQELRKARESVTLLQQENTILKSTAGGENNLTNGLSPHTPPIKKEESEESSLNEVKIKTEPSDTCKSSQKAPENSEKSSNDSNGNSGKSVHDFSNSGKVSHESLNSGKVAHDTTNSGKAHHDSANSGKLSHESTNSEKSAHDATNSARNEKNERKVNHDDESSSDSAALIIKVENEELSEHEDQEDRNKRTLRNKGSRSSTKSDEVTPVRSRRERTKREKSAASDEERIHKKKRRESILSIDYNEADDDELVLTNGETLQSDPE